MAIPLERLEGKYEILEKIQEGGMGAIYKVRHRLLDEIRVIKILRPHLREHPDLQREPAVLAALAESHFAWVEQRADRGDHVPAGPPCARGERKLH